MQITIVTTLETFDWSIWYYHFPIDKETTEKLKDEKSGRVVCLINGEAKIHSALMPLGEGSYIMVNKKVRQQLGLEEGDTVTLELTKDQSTYGIPMPESLQVLLDQDEVGSKYFHALTPGKQRSLIYIVSKVKNVDKQINKGLAILEHLSETQGKLDFKQLNDRIKYYNSRV